MPMDKADMKKRLFALADKLVDEVPPGAMTVNDARAMEAACSALSKVMQATLIGMTVEDIAKRLTPPADMSEEDILEHAARYTVAGFRASQMVKQSERGEMNSLGEALSALFDALRKKMAEQPAAHVGVRVLN